jgi:hypothetical protein
MAAFAGRALGKKNQTFSKNHPARFQTGDMLQQLSACDFGRRLGKRGKGLLVGRLIRARQRKLKLRARPAEMAW